jgi:hypothetical protein
MMRRSVAAILLMLLACGGRQEPPPVVATLTPGRDIKLPQPIEAVPAFELRFSRPPAPSLARRIDRMQDVRVVAGISVEKKTVTAPQTGARLRIGTVQPLKFRSVAPAQTREADFVWSALLSEEAILTPVAAQRLSIAGAVALSIGKETVGVGAFADNGVPNFADVLIPERLGARIGIRKPRILVVGANPKTRLRPLKQQLSRLAPGARISALSEPAPAIAPPQPIGVAEGGLIGVMTFRILKNGFIEPDPDWVAANIVQADVPILGSVTCHRILIPQLVAAFGQLERKGLANLIDVSQYGGCYVPRFISRDPRRGLSMHAFGLAVDLNVPGNHYGTKGNIDPRVVQVFERWGFAWGGHWSPPDPMHFELARLLDV